MIHSGGELSKKALRDVPTGFLGREKQEPWGLTQKGRNEAEASEMGDAGGARREEKKLPPKGSASVRGAVDHPVPRAVSALESRECPPNLAFCEQALGLSGFGEHSGHGQCGRVPSVSFHHCINASKRI